MLKRQMPHALITTANPVFDYELRSVRWPRSVEDLQKYTLNVLVVLNLAIGGLWIISRLLDRLSNSGIAPLAPYVLIAVSSIVITIASDVWYMLTTVGTINFQIASGQWDLLRLTEVRGENILLAKYAIAQIRAWRLMTLEVGVRIAGVVFAALLYPPLFLIILVTLPVSWCLVILVVGYVAEPLWRMQALIALDVALAVRIQNYTFAVLATLGAVLVVEFSRLVALAALAFVVFGLLPYRSSVFCMLPLASLATLYALYFFYRTLQRLSLRQAVRFGTQPG